MERIEKTILTNMCMVYDDNDNKVLVEEKVGKNYKGIIFPGGHIEKNEPVVDSVIREIKEETGLTIRNPKLCGVKDWINEDGTRYIVFLFKTNEYSGTLQSSNEGEVFWIDKDKILELDTMWHMDSMLHIFYTGEFAELFLEAENDWKPVLK